MDDVDPTVPDHLRTVLGEAVEQELESTTDYEWPFDDDEHAAHRDEVMATAHMVDNWEARCPTREEVVRVARRAITEQQPFGYRGDWPSTIETVDDMIGRLNMTRDLIQFRDALGGGAEGTEGDG
jgi:hypothetical protein